MRVPEEWYPEAKALPLDFVTKADNKLGELPDLDARIVVVHTNGGKKQPNTPRVAVSLRNYFNGRYRHTHERLAAHMQFMRNGKIEQYVPFDKQAFAQWAGNPYVISCEFEDDGDPTRPLTPEQVESFIEFMVWTKFPAVIVKDETGHGIGYHQQFRAWNRGGHNCPGSVRVEQLETVIVPAIRRRREPSSNPHTVPHKGATVSVELPVLDEHDRSEGPYPVSAVVLSLQVLLNAAAHRAGTTAQIAEDGKFGHDTDEAVKDLQGRMRRKRTGSVTKVEWSELLGLT